MKTVLHLPKWFPNKFDEQNGIFVDKHIQSISGKDYEHLVLTVFKDSTLKTRKAIHITEKNRISYITVRFKSSNLSLINGLFNVFYLVKYSWLYSKKVNLIHSHIMGRNAFLAHCISRFRSIPQMHTEHWSIFLREELWANKSEVYKYLVKYVFHKSKIVLPVSKALNQSVLSIAPHAKTKVIGNVIEQNTDTNVEKNKIFTFIVVADLRDDVKNISGIISAYKHVFPKLKIPTQLIIIGDGPDANLLKKQALQTATIHFLGRMDNHSVYSQLNAAHVLVLNSKIETFGMVVLEAFSCGIPVICAKNGVTEHFVDSDSGYCISNEKELEESIELMVLKSTQFSKELIKEKAERYSHTSIGKQIANVYKSVLNEN